MRILFKNSRLTKTKLAEVAVDRIVINVHIHGLTMFYPYHEKKNFPIRKRQRTLLW
jgi:hypothetical protein